MMDDPFDCMPEADRASAAAWEAVPKASNLPSLMAGHVSGPSKDEIEFADQLPSVCVKAHFTNGTVFFRHSSRMSSPQNSLSGCANCSAGCQELHPVLFDLLPKLAKSLG